MSRRPIVFQGLYYVLTGLWALVSLSTFEAVTGPKTDDWLVHTVGVLGAAIGLALIVGARRSLPSAEVVVLACGAAFAFACIDVAYALRGTISRFYLADAAVQGGTLVALLSLRVAGGVARKQRPSIPSNPGQFLPQCRKTFGNSA